MFLHKVRSEGLAHLSYVVGDGTHAAVIDPRRDCDVYVDLARKEGARISHIFETHRNEDYVIGSTALAARTGAAIYHGRQLDFEYGKPVSDGDRFDLGAARLTALHTRGHTMESMSYALADTGFGDQPVGVFTGDALFVGDVGRTDFFPDRAPEVADMLYTSIHQKLLPLGDGVIIYPAHGSGSVCGDAMASREFSTPGHERQCNPRLRMGREEFVDFKVNEHHYQPPYFRRMKKLNLEGATHIYLGELPERIEDIPPERPVVTFCGSGRRAMIAASVLQRGGVEGVQNCLGSMQARKALGCEITS